MRPDRLAANVKQPTSGRVHVIRHHIYVISDLHLGGVPAADGKPGFQICSPRSQQMLAEFIGRLPKSTETDECQLIINGDLVDFLAEEPFEAFTADPKRARDKFLSIVKSTAPVWAALRHFVVDCRGTLILMLGNHDIELCLPAVRQALLEQVGEGRVQFIDDNQAFTLGPLLIEHGNRFDAWNAVPYGALRRVRSQLSRRLPVTPAFPILPGSRLVVEAMNPLKKDYPFIDLLKPEDAGALPIVAALGAVGLKDIWEFYRNFRRQHAVDYDENQEPVDPELIAAPPSTDAELYGLARDIEAGGDASQVSAVGNLLTGILAEIDEEKRKLRRAALFKAIRRTVNVHRDTFDVSKEHVTYLKPARRSAEVGFQVVVYGHTHLAKRIPITDDGKSVYINSGTWVDLMRVPDSVWAFDEPAARHALEAFVEDLEKSKLDKWRRSCATYAHIELEEQAVLSATLHFGDNDQTVTTEHLLSRLGAGG
jgi:UDP-2,3-diacylglucosamine pyrophosphatase LpxH